MSAGATVADSDGVRFWLPAEAYAAVQARLWLDLEHNVEPEPMRRRAGGWELALARPPVQRLEYLYALRFGDGSQAMVCDPTNPNQVTTAFGEHSVIEFPGYRPPDWLDSHADVGRTNTIVVRPLKLRRPMPITIWSPQDCPSGVRLPLLCLHDGPEFERLAAVTRFSAAMIAAGRLPAHRVALLGPGDRDRWYAAAPGYARALRGLALPAVRQAVALRGKVVLAGASLGGLAALHAVLTEPGIARALFLQSGSFFRPDLDAHESSFSGYAAVIDFVEQVEAGTAPAARPMQIGMTCGLGEENLANNRLMAQALARLGHDVAFHEVPDAHTYTGWRDALDPHLADLLAAAWAGPG
jgi:enterochelin esterase-like enzyme